MDGSEAKDKVAAVSGIDLNGTWHLADYRLIYADGRVRRPWANSASGSLIYAPDGHMCLSLNFPTQSGRIDCRSVCGQYQIAENRVLHFITISADIREIGTVHDHAMTIEGRRLTLSLAPAPAGGPGSRVEYAWSRAEPHNTANRSFLRANAGRGFNRGR